MNENTTKCVCCGAEISEGRQTCPNCQKNATDDFFSELTERILQATDRGTIVIMRGSRGFSVSSLSDGRYINTTIAGVNTVESKPQGEGFTKAYIRSKVMDIFKEGK